MVCQIKCCNQSNSPTFKKYRVFLCDNLFQNFPLAVSYTILDSNHALPGSPKYEDGRDPTLHPNQDANCFAPSKIPLRINTLISKINPQPKHYFNQQQEPTQVSDLLNNSLTKSKVSYTKSTSKIRLPFLPLIPIFHPIKKLPTMALSIDLLKASIVIAKRQGSKRIPLSQALAPKLTCWCPIYHI